MRQRIVKPSFFTNEDLARLPPLIRIVFLGTWGEADRQGRLEDRPERLKVLIVPFDRIDMAAALQELHDAGFLTRYEADGRKFIQVNAFLQHQRPHPNEPSQHIPPAQSLTSTPRNVIAGRDMQLQAVTNCPGSSGSSLTGSTGSSVLPPTPSAPQNGASRSLLLAEFQAFWRAYPEGHRTAKRKAEEKFIRARKAGVTLQVLLDALVAQAETRAAKTARGEWVPEWCNPATWLNQRRWEDETVALAPTAAKPVARAEWLRLMRDMRSRNRAAFLHALGGKRPEEIQALEQELDALPTTETRQEAS